MSDVKEVQCSFTTFPDDPDTDVTIPGRVVLYYIWPVTGRNASSNDPHRIWPFTPIDIKFHDGDASGDILHRSFVVPGSTATAFNRHSCGEGGLLFPNGLYVDVGNSTPSGTWQAYIAGLALIYGGG